MQANENNCTTDDLVAYLYNELSETSIREVEELLQQRWSLHEKMEVLREAISRLNKQHFLSPRQQTLNAVLSYAQKNAGLKLQV